MSRIIAYFTRDFEHWFKVEIFRRVIYIFLLLNTLSLLPIAVELWSYHGMSGSRWDFNTPTWWQGSRALINVLSHPANHTYGWVYVVFISGQIIFLVTGILRVLPVISSIAVYFFTVNLFLKGALMFTGGEVLLNLVLFYLMFIQQNNNPRKWKISFWIGSNEKPEFSTVQNVLNNTFYVILLIQICLLYFFSTLYKLLDPDWVSGEAVMYISRVSAYSGDAMRFLFSDNYTFAVIATWLVLLYQGTFPVLVWIKKVKIPFLMLGVLIHLGIAFGMGIFTFGVVMCLMYILFLDAGQVERLRRFLRLTRKSV